jgi:hypothetical protein
MLASAFLEIELVCPYVAHISLHRALFAVQQFVATLISASLAALVTAVCTSPDL